MIDDEGVFLQLIEMDDADLMMMMMDDDDVDLSDSSDDEIIDDIISNGEEPNVIGERRRKPRAQNFMEEVIDQYSDEEFREDFR